jgi:hypothetical protein
VITSRGMGESWRGDARHVRIYTTHTPPRSAKSPPAGRRRLKYSGLRRSHQSLASSEYPSPGASRPYALSPLPRGEGKSEGGAPFFSLLPVLNGEKVPRRGG